LFQLQLFKLEHEISASAQIPVLLVAELKHSQSRFDEHGNGRPGRVNDGTHIDGTSAKEFLLE
jgi:hypothetical protein